MKPDQKSVTIGSKSFDAMWGEVAARIRTEVPPPGSINSREFAARMGIGLGAAEKRLWRGVITGQYVRTMVRVMSGNQIRSTWYYLPGQAKKKAA